MERVVNEASGEEEVLREKRLKVETAKDAMRLTDNLIAALARETARGRAAMEDKGNGEEV